MSWSSAAAQALPAPPGSSEWSPSEQGWRRIKPRSQLREELREGVLPTLLGLRPASPGGLGHLAQPSPPSPLLGGSVPPRSPCPTLDSSCLHFFSLWCLSDFPHYTDLHYKFWKHLQVFLPVCKIVCLLLDFLTFKSKCLSACFALFV